MSGAPGTHDLLAQGEEITLDELRLAGRNHALPLEALRHQVTPLGLHYLLIHYDIPVVDPEAWRLELGGRVAHPFELSLEDLRVRPTVTVPVTMECAGNGRVGLSPRPLSQPWLLEAVGTAEWTGTPLRPLLEEAELLDDAVELVFSGLDRGFEAGEEQTYERSLTVAEATGDDVLLAYAANGQPLLPQHGFPLRLVVPGWYGMASVKWLRSITVIDHTYQGVQQKQVHRFQTSSSDLGRPIRKKAVRAAMKPPGIPDLISRERFVSRGRTTIHGMAWSGNGSITKVEVSTDDRRSWRPATLEAPVSPYAWTPWRFSWDANRPGEHMLSCRATDSAGNRQPRNPVWNLQGMAQNGAERVPVRVR